MKRSEAGFSLLEVMTAVAITGGLAAVALPTFSTEVRTSRMDSEVNAFFSELRLREEAFMGEQGRYLSTGQGEADTFPANLTGEVMDLPAQPASWNQLRVRVPDTAASCGFVVIAGDANTTPGAIATQQFGYKKPGSRSWFYMLARCIDGAEEKFFFASDEDGEARSTGDVDPVAHEGEATPAAPGTTPTPPAGPKGNNGNGNGNSNGNGNGGSGPSNAGAGNSESSSGASGASGSSGGNGDTTPTTPTTPPTTPTTGSGNGNGNTTVHANSGAGNGTECVNGVEVDPGNSGSHNNSPESSSCSTTTTTPTSGGTGTTPTTPGNGNGNSGTGTGTGNTTTTGTGTDGNGNHKESDGSDSPALDASTP